MLYDVEMRCDKWKDCDRKWLNSDGGYWCNEECKQKPSRTVEKVLSTREAVYILYANGRWMKKEKKK